LGELSGPLPREIFDLEHLVHVDIAHNKLSGQVRIEWWQSGLLYMNLGQNELSGSIPSEIKDMKHIQELYLDGNKLTGTVPKEIENLTNLHRMWLSDNSFKGPLPSQFFQLERLQELHLSRNVFSGTLATELGNLNHLLDFRVNKNSLLGGEIPESLFSSMKDLTYLDLSECNFTGTISSMVGSLQGLHVFLINDNSFTGSLPVELARVDETLIDDRRYSSTWRHGDVRVQNNNFHGQMPQEFCEQGLATLISDCAALDPVTGEVEIQCKCCTECCDAEGTCTITKDPTNEWEG
jgi:hypothetical protein